MNHPVSHRLRPAILAAAAASALLSARIASAQDASAPAILQWFESTYITQERRAPDFFAAGYGAVWLPPTGRADSGNQSVGYDVYDRFDLGSPGRPTLYGTETGLKTVTRTLQRTGGSVYVDYIINHSGFSNSGTPGFVSAGDYPGFVTTLPGAVDGDYHTAFPPQGDLYDKQFRLAGLIDIDHRTNHRFIRSPVPGFANNIPAGTTPAFGRLADVPDENNRRFYPDRSLAPIIVFDPRTGEQNIAIHPFNNANPLAGDPVEENATGYLMRNAQWMVQHIGVDGFRVDAAKHVYPFALDFFDRAVYRSSFRKNLDGSQRQVFSFLEAYTGNKDELQSYIRKDINPADPGRVGGNRDVLDFPLFFAMRDNLTGNGTANNWHRIRSASQDSRDDGNASNGSQAVAFAHSHDDGGVYLSNVAHAYMLMRPGNAVVYFNAREHGDGRDFPKDGRGDALGGLHGSAITTLVNLRNTHGRGNFRERWVDDAFNPSGFSNIYVYEREKSAVVALNSRLDGGYDERTGVQTAFASGTHLIELTGNAASNTVDPFNDIPEVVTVNSEGKINVRIPRNKNANGAEHGRGYVIYGLATPQGQLNLSGTAYQLAPQTPTAQSNGTTRLSAIDVVTGDSITVGLNTTAVKLLGLDSLRDRDADGDNALLRIDEGLDLNNNGQVDYRSPGSVVYGFEEFTGAKSPGYANPDGNGNYSQSIDTSKLSEGYHFLEVRAFRHRSDAGPPVYSSFKRILYVNRFKPVSAVASFDPIVPGVNENRRAVIRSTDLTGEAVSVFLDLPAAFTDQQVLNEVFAAGFRGQRLDRDLWHQDFTGLQSGNHVLTVVTRELTGEMNVQRFPGFFTSTIFGAGLGDVDFNGSITTADINTFGSVLHSNDAQFNPAADFSADGRVGEDDLMLLQGRLTEVNATIPVRDAYNQLLLNPPPGRSRVITIPFDNSLGSSLTKSSTETVTINGPQMHRRGATLNLTAGTTNINTDAGSVGDHRLRLSVSGSQTVANLGSTQHLSLLSLQSGGRVNVTPGGDKLIAVSGIAIGFGRLELADNHLVLNAPSDETVLLDQLNGYVRTGVMTSSAAAESAGLTTLAVVPNRGRHSFFGGEPLAPTAILAAFTWTGDLDADGLVTPSDYFALDHGRAMRLVGYHNGDVNYSGGFANADDYQLVDRAFLTGGGNTPAFGASASAPAALVPEPAAVLCVGVLPLMLLRRRP